jgi:hypothetical protein
LAEEEFQGLREVEGFEAGFGDNLEMRRDAHIRCLGEKAVRARLRAALRDGPERYLEALRIGTENQYHGVKVEWLSSHSSGSTAAEAAILRSDEEFLRRLRNGEDVDLEA